MGFNPRTREGCDFIGKKIGTSDGVSIHAPARGATKVLIQSPPIRSFNPRTREGCDKNLRDLIILKLSFNPRTREGCDLI